MAKRIFARVAQAHWTSFQVVDELNALGIPTVYARDGRQVRYEAKGKRKERTRETWTPSRILAILKNPMYRGERRFGRRSQDANRKPIISKVPRLVEDDVWYAAQEVLKANRNRPKNTPRVYLLRGVMKCALCGRTYCGTTHHRTHDAWYRCNGHLRRLGSPEVCQAKGVKGDYVEPVVWADVERFLRDPGDPLLGELREEATEKRPGPDPKEEMARWQKILADKDEERSRLLRAYMKKAISLEEFETEAADIDSAKAAIEERLEALAPEPEPEAEAAVDPDLLAEIRRRLDEGLTDEERQEIVSLLVREITIHTEIKPNGKKEGRAVVTYRFPKPEPGTQGDLCVVDTRTGTGSPPPPGCSGPERRRCRSAG